MPLFGKFVYNTTHKVGYTIFYFLKKYTRGYLIFFRNKGITLKVLKDYKIILKHIDQVSSKFHDNNSKSKKQISKSLLVRLWLESMKVSNQSCCWYCSHQFHVIEQSFKNQLVSCAYNFYLNLWHINEATSYIWLSTVKFVRGMILSLVFTGNNHDSRWGR